MYSGGCDGFLDSLRNCQLLKDSAPWRRKRKNVSLNTTNLDCVRVSKVERVRSWPIGRPLILLYSSYFRSCIGTGDTQNNVTHWRNGRKTQSSRVNSPLHLIKHHALKTDGVAVWPHTFLTSSPDQAERSAWFHAAFHWSKEPLVTFGERAGWATLSVRTLLLLLEIELRSFGSPYSRLCSI
jgi:hypothetical protein